MGARVRAVKRCDRREFIQGVGKVGLTIATAAASVGSLGEPSNPGDTGGMILIPGGRFFMGLNEDEVNRLSRRFGVHRSWLSSAVSRREIELPDFHIDKYPITNADYYTFVLDTDMPWTFGKDNPPPERTLKLPVVYLNYATADAYAKWAGKRIPTEQQWEKAARGRRGLLFPWGNAWDPRRCFCNASNTARAGQIGPVDAHPNGASPYGVMDMAGNVCEWTCTAYADGSNAVKGGFFNQHAPFLFLAAYRNMSQLRGNAQDYIGFRCVKEV